MTLSEAIKREAARLGFQAVGISRVEPRSDPRPSPSFTSQNHQSTQSPYFRLVEWLRRGYHGTMAWMARDPDRRAHPQRVLPGCRSILSLGMNYYRDERPDEGPGRGRIARYAWGRDYHDVLQQRLEQLEATIKTLAPEAGTRSYVDTGPVMEKAWAQQAGLGWIGKHSNLVSPQYGSWLLLGEILTTLELQPDEPGADLCGSCTLCIQACPTGAIVEPYVVDARACISYLTIELRGDAVIDPDLADRMGNRIFGCDDCLDACPYNVNEQPTAEPAFQPSALTLRPDLDRLAEMSEAAFTRTFQGSPIRRPKHKGLTRNVGIALKNVNRAGPPELAEGR